MRVAIFAAFAFAALISIGCSSSSQLNGTENADPTPPRVRNSALLDTIRSIGEKHNADTDWIKALDRYPIYTSDIQRAVTISNDRPVLVIAQVRDINQEQGTAIVNARCADATRVYLRLRCNRDSADRLSQARPTKDELNEYSGVVTIPNVFAFIVKATDFTTRKADDSDEFVISGECIDFVALPNYERL